MNIGHTMMGCGLLVLGTLGWAGELRLADPELRECSGIVASRRQPGLFFAHNDSGNAPVLFAIDATGQTRAKYRVAAANRDWEDIALGTDGVYLADIGNNGRSRREVEVLRVAEPRLGAAVAEPLEATGRWWLSYPEMPFDAETLFVIGNQGYIVEKQLARPSGIYRFALDGAAEQKLERVGEVPGRTLWTGGDARADGQSLLLVHTVGFEIYDLRGGISGLATAMVQRVIDFEGGREAGCWLADGGVLTASESRRLQSYSAAAIGQGIRRAPVLEELVVRPAPAGLVVDGRLEEWQDQAAREPRRTPGSPPGARFWLGWQPQGLVVAGIVPDPQVQLLDRGPWYAGDCVEIFLGADRPEHPGTYGPADDRVALVFRADEKGALVARLYWPVHPELGPVGATVAAVLTPDGYGFEAVIPWAGAPLKAGGKLRCAISALSARPRANWYLGTANQDGVYASPLLWSPARLVD